MSLPTELVAMHSTQRKEEKPVVLHREPPLPHQHFLRRRQLRYLKSPTVTLTEWARPLQSQNLL